MFESCHTDHNMQVWFFFNPGSGGDGIVNLFERSNNVVSFDGEVDWWRIHRLVDNKPKFYAPTPDAKSCFRRGLRFDKTDNSLNFGYLECVMLNQNCVVASHDVTLQALTDSDCQDVLCKNQIRVLLDTQDEHQCQIDSTTKNLAPTFIEPVRQLIDHTQFNFVLDVAKIQTDWHYVLSFCNTVGFDLDAEQYKQYQDLLKGNKTHMANNFGIEEYTSQIVDDKITYTLVNTWQSNIN